MKQYIGTKIIQAEPAYSKPGPEPGKMRLPGYKVVYPDGYESWSPKSVFEEAYRPTDGMTFGLALETLKKGKKVARAGWNGKGMFAYLTGGSIVPFENLRGSAYRFVNEASTGRSDACINSHIDMKAADGTIVVGWLASQTDMLAEDWQIVD